jgi:hypothetical protein
MNRHNQSWQRLVAAARQAPADDDSAPYGFATRVAAQAWSSAPLPSAAALLEKFAFRGFVAAAACSLAAAAFGYSTLSAEAETDVSDSVTEFLAQS